MTRWNPWRYFRERHPDVLVHCDRQLRRPSLGEWDGRTAISLDSRLEQAARRCTLTHELVHVWRGPGPADPAGRVREEAIVDDIAARLLVTLPDLLDAILWGQGTPDHRELWVDYPTLRTRMTTLRPDEQRWIDAQLLERVA